MQIFRRFAAAVLCTVLTVALTAISRADAYNGSPKLVIMLMFDQVRGDYLDCYRADFHAANGWNLFLHQGAHFTDCYYDYANLITAAGHSTIGAGAYTDGHGIGLNEWWEPGPDGRQHQASSVEDARYQLDSAKALIQNERLELHSYTPCLGWAVHFNLGAYQYGGYPTGATHYSANSYDRHGPLDFFGAGVQPGTYHDVVAPVDVAATLASMLRINRPSAVVGSVLTEAMKPDPAQAQR